METIALSFAIVGIILAFACCLGYLAAWSSGMPACPSCCCEKEDLKTPLLYQEEFGV
jgi:hypothetical protein